MEFLIEVRESICKTVRIEAEDEQAACTLAGQMYDRGEIDMYRDVNIEVNTRCVK